MLAEQIIPYAGISPGARILDLGCGDGFHSKILADLGFIAYGIDNSAEGISRARERNSAAQFICASADTLAEHFAKEYFDCVYCRGLSWYHYELNSHNQFGIDVMAETKNILQYLKPGGIFILQIATDYSGGRDAVSGVVNNTLNAYLSFFSAMGKVERLADWRGNTTGMWYGVSLFLRKL